jgi:hypothetical protein
MRQLVMKYAGGGVVRHLGLQNYKGPVAAIAELVANAWDADSKEVRITIPLGRPIKSEDQIVVRDYGHGMCWEDCDEKYLVIARNRRDVERTDRTANGRPLMAHKGLGKLAGFGIAKTVDVKTISKGKITHFKMSFDDLDALRLGQNYEPKMLADEKATELPDGTEIVLQDLSLQRAIPEEYFFNSMSVKFSVMSDKFKVFVNDKLLEKKCIPLEFRFPEEVNEEVTEIDKDGFGRTILSNGLPIKWWIGFMEEPIQTEEFHGISIVARGRAAQDPWDFDLAGGAWGQHGLRYMTGEIVADFVDEGIPYENDTILTNRSGLNWESPKNRPLYEWARKKIRDLLREWSDRRGKKTLEKVQEKHPELVEKINRFQPREQKELNMAMRALAQVPTMQPEKLTELFNHVIDGYQDKVLVNMIQEIIELPPGEMQRTIEILTEFDILEAIRVHKFVSSHVLVIRRFREMIDAGVPEKPDMHDHIRKYPWLLGIKYQPMDYEHSLRKVLDERFGIKSDDKAGKKIPDIVVMRAGTDVLVIELKRPDYAVGKEELNQIKEYVDYLREWLDGTNTEGLIGKRIKGENVEGYLIAYDIRDDALVRREKARLEKDRIKVCKWYDILMKTEDDHRDFLEIVRKRAPKDDPRIRELEEKDI